jgi:hypothetical protein
MSNLRPESFPADPYPQITKAQALTQIILSEHGVADFSDLPQEAKNEYETLMASMGWCQIDVGGEQDE